MDAYGAAINLYPSRAPLGGPAPAAPWAVHLADATGAFRLLVFDLDAHDAGQAERAAQDADVLAQLLGQVSVEYVVCASGPGGGRHVWVALAEAVAAGEVAALARLARAVCPSLDISPLSNPTTGCARPPGAPHRAGGISQVIAGDLAVLAAPSTSAAQVGALAAALAKRLGPLASPAPDDYPYPAPGAGAGPAGQGGLTVFFDEGGHPYLGGARRALPPCSAAARDVAPPDASAGLRTVLLGAASARWRYDDVAALLASAPGLEHARTMRVGPARHRRPARGPASSASVLARQWDKAVRHVAATGRQVGGDPTFDARAGAVAEVVRVVRARAATCPGYWQAPTGPVQHRVLSALCQIALAAVTDTVAASDRQLAVRLGIGRESARTALLTLAERGWITRVQQGPGVGAARWKIGFSTALSTNTEGDRSQADPRPAPPDPPPVPLPQISPGTGAAHRTAALAELTTTIEAFAHDAFTHRGLGFLVGNVYSSFPTPYQQDAITTGPVRAAPRRAIAALLRHGLITGGPSGYAATPPGRREAVAAELGVDGVLARRADAYALERQVWAWWQAEAGWMAAPARTAPARRAGPGQLEVETGTASRWRAHPRGPDGRCDYKAARAHLATSAQPLPPTRAGHPRRRSPAAAGARPA